jgi:hypothetical protein
MRWIVVALVPLALLLGFLIGRWVSDTDPGAATKNLEASDETEGGFNAVGRGGTEEATDLRVQNERLKEQLARLQGKLLVQGMAGGDKDEEPSRRDKYAPMEWPKNTPPAFGPDQFKRLFRKIAQETEDEVDIVGIHCDEPPCLVFRRVPPVEDNKGWGDLFTPLQSTDTWKKHFPDSIGHQGAKAQCGDGRTETVQIIWLTPDEWDEHFIDDMLSRRWIRVREILDNWKCLPPE